MESQPQNPEFRNNPETFHPCIWEESLSIFYSAMNVSSFHNNTSCTHYFQIIFVRGFIEIPIAIFVVPFTS